MGNSSFEVGVNSGVNAFLSEVGVVWSCLPQELSRPAYAILQHDYRKKIEDLKRLVDRDEWEFSPQTVNAFYYAPLNEIMFPAAVLQEPLFSFFADDALNYGAIGYVIGHELMHCLDDQ
ncbi:unnamed protein product, partial [Adineta steineri]